MKYDSDTLSEIDSDSNFAVDAYLEQITEKSTLESEIRMRGNATYTSGFVEDLFTVKIESEACNVDIGYFENPSELRELVDWLTIQADNFEEYRGLMDEFKESNDLETMSDAEILDEMPTFDEVWPTDDI